MRKTFIRMAAAAAISALSLLWLSCGETFRPIITPFPEPGGDPQATRRAIVLHTAGTTAQGAAANIDVSGDTDVGDVYVGTDPVWVLQAAASTYVVNRGSKNLTLYSTFSPSTNPTTISLPATSSPVFAVLTNNTVYVADPANDEVDIVASNVETGEIAVGTDPVSIAAIPDGSKIYVANQGSDSVSVITTQNNQVATTLNLAAGAAPAYAVASPDNKWVFVAESGTGKIAIINPADNTFTEVDATTPANAGAGPSFLAYENTLKRLYVVNKTGNSLSIFDATGTTPTLLATVGVGSGPTSVAALADGSRAYTSNQGDGTVSVVNVQSFTKTKDIPAATGGQQAMWVAASSDSKKVFVAVKGSNDTTDPGFTGVIPTSSDTLVTKINPPRVDPNCNTATTTCKFTQPILVVSTQ